MYRYMALIIIACSHKVMEIINSKPIHFYCNIQEFMTVSKIQNLNLKNDRIMLYFLS